MLLGCIGDDFTGSSDIANTLAKGGMAVTQYNGIPDRAADDSVEAGVISLKSRTEPVDIAVESSVRAANWLLEQGCEQLFFKYCSTFDSTPQGNIGPVADALAELVGATCVLFCPAFPETGRTVYQGHLFVSEVPLHESGMKDHPLTPMTDSDLRRWLSRQTEMPVKHLPFKDVNAGPASITARISKRGDGYYIADAITEENLRSLGEAAKSHKLVTGGSGLALGLPENFRKQGKLGAEKTTWTGITGPGVILSGSCSFATRNQVSAYKKNHPSLELSAEDLIEGNCTKESICDWFKEQDDVPLVYTSADPVVVLAAQEMFGRERIAEMIENLFADLAVLLVQIGVSRIVTAGGETSGAVVKALDIKVMEIGPEIATGVPALSASDRDLTLALKSGNFGGENFFEDALKVLTG